MNCNNSCNIMYIVAHFICVLHANQGTMVTQLVSMVSQLVPMVAQLLSMVLQLVPIVAQLVSNGFTACASG